MGPTLVPRSGLRAMRWDVSSLDVLPNGAEPSTRLSMAMSRYHVWDVVSNQSRERGRLLVLDDSHPKLRCKPTMTMQRTPLYVSGCGESVVPTTSASELSSIDESERTLQGSIRKGGAGAPECTSLSVWNIYRYGSEREIRIITSQNQKWYLIPIPYHFGSNQTNRIKARYGRPYDLGGRV